MTATNIKNRIERLEGQKPTGESPTIIMIVGVEPVKEPTGEHINGVPQYRMRPSDEPPTSFFAYCLYHDCDANQHSPHEGEALAEFKVRMDLEHEGVAA